MSPLIVLGFVLVIFVVLLSIQVPVAFALLSAGALGAVLTDGWSPALSALASVPFSGTAKYSLILVPMFIFMGVIVSETGIAREIYNAAHHLVGRLPGGLAMAAIVACTFFGGISGSSAADVATIGRISIREMRRHGYSSSFAAAVVAAGGTTAILIPPSIVLVIYGIIAAEPIGTLLLAGIVPGILTGVAYMTWIFISEARGRAHPELLKRIRTEVPAGNPDNSATTSLLSDLIGVGLALVLFLVVMGGIYTGVFTATEAGAVGALTALILGMIRVTFSRRRNIWKVFKSSLLETASVSSMIFAILIGGSLFTSYVLSAGIPATFTRWVVDLPVPPIAIVVFIILMMVPLGMLLDGLSMLLITVPLAHPVITELGFSGIWFGILMIASIELSLITPPVGLNVYVIAGLDDDLTAEGTFRAVVPFIGVQVALLAVFLAFPAIITWLPATAAR